MDVDQKIWQKFRVHRGDNLPFYPWLEGASRVHLAELFGDLGYKVGAEVGVRMGEYSRIMFEKNPQVTIYCVDPWAPYGRLSQARQDRYFRRCRQLLAPYKAIYLRMPSTEAVLKIPDGALDFAYIDGLHDFDSVITDIILWSAKVKPGGIIAGHDYAPYYQYGIIPAVHAYTQAHHITMWYVTRDEHPSFFWVKR